MKAHVYSTVYSLISSASFLTQNLPIMACHKALFFLYINQKLINLLSTINTEPLCDCSSRCCSWLLFLFCVKDERTSVLSAYGCCISTPAKLMRDGLMQKQRRPVPTNQTISGDVPTDGRPRTADWTVKRVECAGLCPSAHDVFFLGMCEIMRIFISSFYDLFMICS